MSIQIFLMFLMGLLFFKTNAQDAEVDSVLDESSRTFLPTPLIINNPSLETGFGAGNAEFILDYTIVSK